VIKETGGDRYSGIPRDLDAWIVYGIRKWAIEWRFGKPGL